MVELPGAAVTVAAKTTEVLAPAATVNGLAGLEGYARGEIRQHDLNGTRKGVCGIDGDGDRWADAALRNGDGG